MKDLPNYLENHRERILEELFELLRIPSVSADPAYKNDVAKAAEVVAEHLKSAGCVGVTIFPPEGQPMV